MVVWSCERVVYNEMRKGPLRQRSARRDRDDENSLPCFSSSVGLLLPPATITPLQASLLNSHRHIYGCTLCVCGGWKVYGGYAFQSPSFMRATYDISDITFLFLFFALSSWSWGSPSQMQTLCSYSTVHSLSLTSPFPCRCLIQPFACTFSSGWDDLRALPHLMSVSSHLQPQHKSWPCLWSQPSTQEELTPASWWLRR